VPPEAAHAVSQEIDVALETADAALETADAVLETADAALETADAALESVEAGSQFAGHSSDAGPQLLELSVDLRHQRRDLTMTVHGAQPTSGARR
jgi:hypothetical protein